ncbi:MAG TPA: hypothetical protein VKF17_17965 [Isosphaeraceae bacterium]|nr:hypothetical protein [Isosphaeraceae bacterium]
MASYDPEFDHAPKFSPEYDDSRPRQRGCFFYGCVIASVLAVLLIIALAVLAFVFMRFFSGLVEEWTSPAPVELPRVQVSEQERKSVRERVDAFRKALEDGTATDPLVLTSDDLNALIEENSNLRGRLFARVEGDKLKAQISLPLEMLKIGMLKGRYLNGEAELKASLSEGILVVTLEMLEVNGKHPPEQFLAELRKQNLAKDAYDNPKNAEMIRRFESLEIKDGKIILKPRIRAKPTVGPAQPQPPATTPSPPGLNAPQAEAPKHQTAAPKVKQPG